MRIGRSRDGRIDCYFCCDLSAMAAPVADAAAFLDAEAMHGPQAVLRLRGAWTLAQDDAVAQVVGGLTPAQVGAVDLSGLDGLDTAGAMRLCELVGGERLLQLLPA